MKKLYLSNKQIKKSVHNIIAQMYADSWRPDYIVGITRGGLVPAVLVSHLTGIKMYTLDVRLRDGEYDNESNCWMAEDAHAGKKILIVDDINDSGATLEWIKKDWNSSVYNMEDTVWGNSVRFATIVNNLASPFNINYSCIEINKAEEDVWVVFPYEEWW
jgi:hypoxanthine phosphoribosyltransferase